MNKNMAKIMAISLGAFIAASSAGCGATNRNAQNNPNGTQQNRNIVGENLQGSDPNAGPGRGNSFGGNTDAGSGNNPGMGTPNTDMGTPNNLGNTPGTPGQGAGQRLFMGFDGTKADNIRNRIGTIDGASQINAIVSGNTALVGYNPTGAGKNAAAIRDTITSRIKQMDNTITNVVVTDSADIRNKMNQLSSDIQNNKAGSDLGNRFNQLIQSIQPKTGR